MFFRRKKSSPTGFSGPTSPWPRMRPRRQRLGRSLHQTMRPSVRKEKNQKNVRNTVNSLGKNLKKILILGVVVGILGWGSYFLFFSDQLTVKTIQVVEAGNADNDHPLKDLLVQFEGSNLLLVKVQELENYLRQKYPTYQSIEIRKEFPDTLTIQLTPYPEVANVKIEENDGEEQIWLLNSHGNLVNGEASDQLPWIKVDQNQSFADGSELMSQERLAFVLEAIQNFEDRFGMKVIHAYYLPEAREVHLWTEREFYVWLDLAGDLDQQLNKLKKALSKLNIYELSLEYIDLRINGINGEKVIYKTTNPPE